MCHFCRHIRVPITVSAFVPGTVISPGQQDGVTKERVDNDHQRTLEENRYELGDDFDRPPRYFPWCAKFTLSSDEVDEINRRLSLGDHQLARDVVDKRLALLDGAAGVVVPIYQICNRLNPANDCEHFEQETPEAS